MKIREFGMSARTKMCLLTAGYEEMEDLRDITNEQLLEIRNLNKKSVSEIRAAIGEYFGYKNSEILDDTEKYLGLRESPLDELNLSVRTYNCLKKAGFSLVSDICEKTMEDIRGIRGLGKKSLEELLSKMNEQGLLLRDQKDLYYFMAGYPESIRDIVKNKKEGWALQLYQEAVIYKCEELQKYRSQKSIVVKRKKCLKRIESNEDFCVFLKLYLGKLVEFVNKMHDCMKIRIEEGFRGELKEPEDEKKIIEVVEKSIQVCKDVILCKMSLEDIDCGDNSIYKRILEQLIITLDSILDNFDVCCSKMRVAQNQLKELLAGNEVEIDIHIEVDESSVIHAMKDLLKVCYEWVENIEK